MKYLSFIALLILAFANSLSAQTISGESFANAQITKKAKISVVYLAEDSFAYLDEKGHLTGVEGDIFTHFQNWLKNSKGIELDVTYIGEPNFAKFYQMVKDGDGGVIGLGTVTILERRKKDVKYSPPFMNNIAILATHSSIPTLSSLDNISTEFASLKGLAAKGTTLETYLVDLAKAHYPSAKLEYLPSQGEVAQRLVDDPSYFAYMDLSTYWPSFSKLKMPIKRHPVGDLSAETFGFIMPLSSDWDSVLTEFFQIGSGYRSTLMYRNVLIKHLGVEVTKMLEIARTTSQDK